MVAVGFSPQADGRTASWSLAYVAFVRRVSTRRALMVVAVTN